jgi:AraC-like DNA-binding protein
MLNTRHEQYNGFIDGLPFVFYHDLKRSRFIRSESDNWHENLEIQLCTEGSGVVLINNERYTFNVDDVTVVNSNAIHYTGTDTLLTYSCLIVSTDFCKQVGIDVSTLTFKPKIQSETLVSKLINLTEIYLDIQLPYRVAKLNKLLLEILIELVDKHVTNKTELVSDVKKFDVVKGALCYIRENYQNKITIEAISKKVLYDKYALCREFKKFTGQTIIENLNNYRCIKAIDYLSSGFSVADTASLCGFDNLSFFTKTFKKHIGKLPKEYKLSKE